MRITVIGATGNVGSRTITAALDSGHEVVAYARRPDAVPPRERLTVIGGELTDARALAAALTGADAVIVAATGSLKDATFMQRTLPLITEAMAHAQVSRLVLVSALGVGDTIEKTSPMIRVLLRTLTSRFFADKAAAERALSGTGLDSTIAYAVNMEDAPALPEAEIIPINQVGKVPGMPTVPYVNMARALIQITEDPSTIGQRLLVTTPTGWRPIA
ncbi:NAD(P)-dependent oxidoreductase [Microbacterium aurum]